MDRLNQGTSINAEELLSGRAGLEAISRDSVYETALTKATQLTFEEKQQEITDRTYKNKLSGESGLLLLDQTPDQEVKIKYFESDNQEDLSPEHLSDIDPVIDEVAESNFEASLYISRAYHRDK